MLVNNKSTIKWIEVDVLELTIENFSRLPIVGEEFPKWGHDITTRNKFALPREKIDSSSQDIRQLSLPWLWNSIVIYIIKYLTCEGRQSLLYTIHFKLISHFYYNQLVNVPNFLFHLLKRVSIEFKKGNESNLSHHCLIQLMIN